MTAMSSYGVYEDDELITGVFTDLGSAEDYKEQLQADTGMIYGVLEALPICDEHEVHPHGYCDEQSDAEDTALLQQVRAALEKL